jgi:hypothetical protein
MKYSTKIISLRDSLFKGTVSWDFLLCFFHETTFPNLIRHFWVFEELFEVLINSPVYSPPGEATQIGLQKTCWGNRHQVVKKDSPVLKTLGSLDLLIYLSPESFFVNLFWCLFKVLQEVDSLVYSSQGNQDLPVYSPLGSRNSLVYSPLGSRDSLLYSSSESNFGRQGVVLQILSSILPSLKGLSF